MTSTIHEKQTKAQLIDAAAEAYFELFVMQQFNAVSHWLMHELTFAQARALIILAARKTLTLGQLASLLGVGNPTASVLVQQLVERGLVTRAEHPDDRRRTILALSEKGAEIGAGRRREREKQWRRWLSHLSEDDLDALARGLAAFKRVVDADIQTPA